MAILPQRTCVRNSKQLSSVDWLPNEKVTVVGHLSITKRLQKQFKLSPSVLNAMAEANGYIGQEMEND